MENTSMRPTTNLERSVEESMMGYESISAYTDMNYIDSGYSDDFGYVDVPNIGTDTGDYESK